jgi:dynein heavy chain
MLLMVAMGPPGRGRNQVSNRLLSRFNVINMTFPSETQIGRIFGTLLKQHVADFEEEVRMIGKQNMSVVWKQVL